MTRVSLKHNQACLPSSPLTSFGVGGKDSAAKRGRNKEWKNTCQVVLQGVHINQVEWWLAQRGSSSGRTSLNTTANYRWFGEWKHETNRTGSNPLSAKVMGSNVNTLHLWAEKGGKGFPISPNSFTRLCNLLKVKGYGFGPIGKPVTWQEIPPFSFYTLLGKAQ